MQLLHLFSAAGVLFPAVSTAAAPFSSLFTPRSTSDVDMIAFQNVGYKGHYYDVASLPNAASNDCSCKLSDSYTNFEGSNAPLNEELSIHFRGPLSLKSFGAYTANDSSSGPWSRISYFDGESQTSSNVTFLTHAGEASTCLGRGLSYASKNGTGSADTSTILEASNLINSNEEFVIFSGVECPASGAANSCGVYRSGIPAFHGFAGSTKMFLFEFEMPETNVTSEYYNNMPAIWFLNAKIPRTAQYANSSSCSCWNSGCGEIDIFEVMNSSTTNQLYSTIHDYQGSGDINYGIQADGYFARNTKSVMKGGVVFETNGTISIFMSDNMAISESLEASSVSSWISQKNEVVDVLSSVTMQTSSTASKKSNGVVGIDQGWIAGLLSMFFSLFIYI